MQKEKELQNDISAFAPLFDGDLNKLSDKVFKEQFFDWDETIDCKSVLIAIQNINDNPMLLDYVLKCLNNQKIETKPNKFYCVIINAEKYIDYDERLHKNFERYIELYYDGKCIKNKRDHLIKKVFNSYDEIENFMLNYNGEIDLAGYGIVKFDKYTIHQIGLINDLK